MTHAAAIQFPTGALAPILADATLPTGTRSALAVAMLAGICLILFGARVLRPAVVLAAMTIGFLGAIVAARHALPQVPLWAAAATGAVAGLLGGALLYRPTVAVAAASVGATVGAIIAFAVMAGGSLDTAPRDLGHALVASPREAARPGDGQRAGMRLLSVLAPMDASDDALARTADAAAPAGERLLRDTADAARRAWERASAACTAVAPAYRTLLVGSVATGALSGLLLGFVATNLVARVLTSFAGGWLLLGGALALMATRGIEPMPDDARAWLVALGALAALGTFWQSWTGADAGLHSPAPWTSSRTKAARSGAKASPSATSPRTSARRPTSTAAEPSPST